MNDIGALLTLYTVLVGRCRCPVSVLCECCLVSAGVGRSGAFIALDSLLDQAKAEAEVDVYAFTCSMRKNRANMIQTVVRCSYSAHLYCILN